MNDTVSVVHRFPNLDTLSRSVAEALVRDITTVLESRDEYTLALAGGSTPKRLYELLAEEYEDALPWSRIHLFWGDERYVPADHPKSNYRLAKTSLIDHVPIPDTNVHAIPTEQASADAAAASYADTLRTFFATPDDTFDTVLLGLGRDGHTASLFPEADSPEPNQEWVRVVTAPDRHEVSTRITCTLPVLNGARDALFLVSGGEKRDAVQRVLDERDRSLPAARVRPRDMCHWYVDHAASPHMNAL